MVKDVQPIEKGLVTRSNKLIEARYKLSLQEQKVVYSIISLIQPEDKDLHTYRFKVSDLAKFCGINAKNAYRDLEEVTRTLRSRVLTIKREPKRTLQTGWINNAEYYHAEGIVEFQLDEKLKPYLLGLKQVFTSMKVSELMSFKSQYAGRLYELLYQHRAFGSRRFTLAEFKEMIGLDKKEYPLFGHIKARIIEPAIKDINKNTPMEVTYEPQKDGKKVVTLTFTMKHKPQGTDMDLFAQEEIEAAKKEAGATAAPDQEQEEKSPILTLMIKMLGDKPAAELFQKHGEAYCRSQLDYTLLHANEKPSSYFKKSCLSDWAGHNAKEAMVAAQSEKKRQAEERQRQPVEPPAWDDEPEREPSPEILARVKKARAAQDRNEGKN